jgi:molybdopterin molybdotransferase
MITLDKAIDIVLSASQPLVRFEEVSLWESLGRVLADNIVSDMNMPPFDKTAVDGFACRMVDAGGELEVIEVIPAGATPAKSIGRGQCAKIMTGAMIPPGADCVLMVEDTREVAPGRIVFTGNSPKSNICKLGEDIKLGDRAIPRGAMVAPQHIAIMASLGYSRVQVAAKPGVAILATGDELVEPEVKPQAGQIRNSNGHQLVAQVVGAGATPHYYGIVRDTHSETRSAITKAFDENDIVILTGGVSMGDFDLVPGILEELGVRILFDSIAVQPGKPTTFGVKGHKLVFGLPGNPVSAFLQFELLIRPAIHRLMGCHTEGVSLRLPMAHGYKRKKTERLGLIPVRVSTRNGVEAVDYHGSAHIFALAGANAVAIIPQGVAEIKLGEVVDVRLL